jgi:drug/metabolite transporter (DMT)-like permease
MVNKKIFLIVLLISISISVARTFDYRASNGTLSITTVTFISYLFVSIVTLAAAFIVDGKTIFREVKGVKGPEWKYMMLSAFFWAPATLLLRWTYTKEKANIVTMFSVGFGIVSGLVASSLILKEQIPTSTWIGGAVVLLGLAMINLLKKPEQV